MKKFLTTLLGAAFMMTCAVVHAEIKTYEGVGEYIMTDETIDFAKNQAELFAERDALEQVSVYIKSQTKTVNSVLDSDEIIMISAGILHVTETKFQIEPTLDGLNVKAFITAEIDTTELEELLEQAIKERLPDE